MDFLVLVLVGALVGLTTVLFGFGGGFVTVPIITLIHADLGSDTARVAAATSALVMLVNAVISTISTKREALAHLKGEWRLFILLAAGGAFGAFCAEFAPETLLKWGFVIYIAVTAIDLLVRPGFFRRGGAKARRKDGNGGDGRNGGAGAVSDADDLGDGGRGIAALFGFPIGGLASFLGVGGSVMTVPMMRRSGATMTVATTLANPLTLVIMLPAVLVTITTHASTEVPGMVGSVDLRSALALLIGAIPLIILLRRRVPEIPEIVHAWGYVILLITAGVVVAVS
ncbi:sulfite exporter TauE/SafE family protein [Brevibacterium aurantiacum]|uniref:Probable membrane transporter protein n=1 Tax=Brevibacterium aurantiacum TaxID=273384 RepID=A0A556CPU6_BREAU|nr:sulfite exporter TauE/SafE family protein [Brevibacterium aurantiacum]TSI19447.1 sulfite exporter TauE/SafE family protein [Brevibacterium aurantiacum]